MVDGRRTDNGPWLYYKLTNESKGSGELKILIWATSWENLFMPYANNKGADQPARLLSVFVIR